MLHCSRAVLRSAHCRCAYLPVLPTAACNTRITTTLSHTHTNHAQQRRVTATFSTAAAAATAVDSSLPSSPPPRVPSPAKKAKKSTLRVVRSETRGYETVIGMEVHAQMIAASKLFSSCSTAPGSSPNTQAGVIDAAMPGSLPILNRFGVEQAIRTGIGIGGEIQRVSKFERKHYFYADMPQGYQITQQQFPIVRGGCIVLNSTDNDDASSTPARSIRVTRIQLEQDSGKSIHDLHPTRSYVDLNRAGVGLMEIVSEADIRSSDEAAMYIRKLSSLLQTIGTCRAHMEDGSLRVDVNISIHRPGEPFGERVEVKNLNSIRSLQRAIEFEVARQIDLTETGQSVLRETRSFDAKTGATILMRSKENMLDYRFSPEPDLPPLILSTKLIEEICQTMPELPEQRSERFKKEYGLSSYDIGVILAEDGASEFLDELVYGVAASSTPRTSEKKHIRNPKRCANWLTNELFGRLKKLKQDGNNFNLMYDEDGEPLDNDVSDVISGTGSSASVGGRRGLSLSTSPVSSSSLGELIDLIEADIISGKVGKDVLDQIIQQNDTRTPIEIVEANNWKQVQDTNIIDALCREVISSFPIQVAAVVSGQKRQFGFLSGQVLQLATKKGTIGQLSPSIVSKRLMAIIQEGATTKS